MDRTNHAKRTSKAAPAKSTPRRPVATHAAFAMLVTATFAILLALSPPLSRLGGRLFTSGGLLSPKGGPITNILGLPGLPGISDLVPGAAPIFATPGVTGVLAPVPALAPPFGPANVGPPPPPGTVVTPPVVFGGGPSTGPVGTPQPRPSWWTNLTAAQRHVVARHIAHRHWKQTHAKPHRARHKGHHKH